MSTKSKKQTTEYRNYFLPPDFPVVFLTGENWKISDIPSENLHFHNCLEIGICHSDHGFLKFYNGTELPFSEGDTTFIPRNIPHTTYSSPGCQSRWSYLFFDPKQLFKDMLISNFIHPLTQEDVNRYIIPAATSERISFLVSCIIEELSVKAPNYLLCKNYLFSFYLELCRYALDSAPGDSLSEISSSNNCDKFDEEMKIMLNGIKPLSIYPALEYIENNYMNQFPIEILAEISHMSLTHFRRMFQRIMHTSPLSYLNRVRIINACNLLQNTNQTILAISEMSGFSSLSNFNRHFNDLMKISPREYRKKTLKTESLSSILKCTGWKAPEGSNTPPIK